MQTSQIIALRAESSIHAGAGSSLGYIDLPIQREAHTTWPCIYGSSIKGALRAAATLRAGNDEKLGKLVRWMFGPETQDAGAEDAAAGALIFTDARLLLLPVRSLTSHFRWVTCPAILQRMSGDLRRLGINDAEPYTPAAPGEAEAMVCGNQLKQLYLDELNFPVADTQIDKSLVNMLRRATGIETGELESKLVVVSDNRFSHLARYATAVTTHVKLTERKTVQRGALWTEEALPPDTVLYMGVHVSARAGDRAAGGLEDLARLAFAHGYFQVGANETVGMGFVRATATLHD